MMVENEGPGARCQLAVTGKERGVQRRKSKKDASGYRQWKTDDLAAECARGERQQGVQSRGGGGTRRLRGWEGKDG